MRLLLIFPLLALTACATPKAQPGMLSSYEGLQPRSGTVRAKVAERRDDAALAGVKRVALAPTVLVSGEATSWLSETERKLVTREMDAQLCFELTERYDLAASPAEADAQVRAVITGIAPTGRVGSAVSATSGFFIPGPIGLRPGGLGGLAAEAEMLDRSNRQLAAITWSRGAAAIGADSPSFSRVGDALQFAEPFADAAAAVMTPKGGKSRAVPKPDPCAAYGPRQRPAGFLTKFATGLYVPQVSSAKPQGAAGTDRPAER